MSATETVKLGGETSNLGPLRLPKDIYKLRIKDEPKLHVKQGTDTKSYLFEFELVDPATKVIDGKERKIAGTDFKQYCSIEPGKTFMLEQLHNALKLPMEFQKDIESGLPVGISYAGLEVQAKCVSEETPELNGDKEPMINPVTGSPLMQYNKRIIAFY